MKRVPPLLLSIFCFLLSGRSANVTIAWTPLSSDYAVTNYTVCWGTQSEIYTQQVNAGTNAVCTVSNLNYNVVYYFAVVAENSAGDMSLPSDELQWAQNKTGIHIITP